MTDKKVSIKSLLLLAADSSKMPGFDDSLSALLEEEVSKHQSDELSEDELSLAAGGISDLHDKAKENLQGK